MTADEPFSSQSCDVFRQIADSLPQIVWALAPNGSIAWVNRRFIEATGRDVASESAIDDEHLQAFVHPDDLGLADTWRAAYERGESYEYEFRMKVRGGAYRWFLAHATPYRDATGAIEWWCGISTDIHERKRSADMLAFLAEASDVLSSSRALSGALETASQLAVPRIADWCAVYLREPDGYFRPAAIHHADPAKVQLANELVRRYPFSVDTERRLIETRTPLFMPLISPEMIQAGAIDDRHGAVLQQLDIASAIVVPLIVNDEVTGMVHLVRGRANEPFVSADVDFAQILANRIAVAIDNAVVYERERNVATTFQNAALPRSMPQIGGLALHHAYHTGDRAASVGGDWYDAVQLPDGSLLFSIGDVAGKGLDAAVLMASMRQAIRVAGLQGLAPGAVLEAANASLAAERTGRCVTAFVGRLDVATGMLHYASAGHPPPLVREGDAVRALLLGDPPLGAWEGDFTTHDTVLTAPWLLVAYTDGLIERTGNIVEGETALREMLAHDGIEHAADPAAYLQRRLLRGQVRDDTAILSIRSDEPKRWRFGADDALIAESARQRLTAWLATHTRVETCAAEIICGELIGNVVRHAPGPIDIDVRCMDERVRIFVQSSGQAIALKARLPLSILSESGRGLFIIESLGHDLAATTLPVMGNQVAVDLPVHDGTVAAS